MVFGGLGQGSAEIFFWDTLDVEAFTAIWGEARETTAEQNKPLTVRQAMGQKNHFTGDGTIDSSDLATILRERKKTDSDPYPRDWTHKRPRSWAEAVRSIFRREPPFPQK